MEKKDRDHPNPNQFSSFLQSLKKFLTDKILQIRVKQNTLHLIVVWDFNYILLDRKLISDEKLCKLVNKVKLRFANIL